MTIIRYGIIAHRQTPKYRGTGGAHGWYTSISASPWENVLERREREREERRGRSPVFLPDSVNAKRKDPRHLSDRLSLFCRSASGYSPHVVLGQEVRLRSGRNLSRGATLSPPRLLSHPSSPLASISFHPGGGWRAKGFRPADEANEFGSARCTLFGAKGSVGGK